ncbi:MAG: hypothetical protein H6849_01245 [Alphaproteobacteria bacterium]|nr:MAG: hypothetical protein H6849_01245 [Alphaproteobacteria bacterium]
MRRMSLLVLLILPLLASYEVPSDLGAFRSFSGEYLRDARGKYLRDPREEYVFDFCLSEGKNAHTVEPFYHEGQISFRRREFSFLSDGEPFEKTIFDCDFSRKGFTSPNGDLNLDIAAYRDGGGGFLSAAGDVRVICSDFIGLCESKIMWGGTAGFYAAPETPSALYSIELLPKGLEPQRAIVWGNIDFKKPGVVMGPTDIPVHESVGQAFSVCGANIRITVQKFPTLTTEENTPETYEVMGPRMVGTNRQLEAYKTTEVPVSLE